MGIVKSPEQNIIAIGGIGGSGTRLIADIAMRLGFHMGSCLNPSLDNLWFTLLFQQPRWFERFPPDSEIAGAIELFHKAMTTGLASGISSSQANYIRDVIRDQEQAKRATGADRMTAEQLLASTPPDLANHVGWGWKEPNTHIFLPQIASALTKLKYIHVIRHGLDMAFSKNRNQLRNWGNFICNFSNKNENESPLRALEYWIAANLRAIRIGKNQLQNRF